MRLDTVEELEAAQELYGICAQMQHTNVEKAKEITRVADAGFSALIPYIKNRAARVQKRHYTAMLRMIECARNLRVEVGQQDEEGSKTGGMQVSE